VTLPQNLLKVTLASTVMESFETTTGWTMWAGTVENNTTQKVYGTQSIKLVHASGVGVDMQKAITSFSMAGAKTKRFRLYVYHHTAPTAADYRMLFYSAADKSKGSYVDSGWTQGYTPVLGWNIYNVGADFAGSADGGIVAAPPAWTDLNGNDNWDTLPRVYWRLNEYVVAGQTPNTSIDLLMSVGSDQAVPAVMFMFDDCYPAVATVALPYLRAHGIRATMYLETGNVDVAGNMTTAQVASLYAAGWDLGNHSIDATDLTTLSEAEATSNLATAKAWLDTRGYTRASAHCAYPNGGYNATVQAAAAAAGCVSGRSTIYNCVLSPWPDWFAVQGRMVGNTTSLAQAKATIDNIKARGEVVPFIFHNLVVGAASSTTEWNIDDFKALVDYIVAQGVTPITVTDLYGLQSGPVTIPAVV